MMLRIIVDCELLMVAGLIADEAVSFGKQTW
jgi:hypothetical protein